MGRRKRHDAQRGRRRSPQQQLRESLHAGGYPSPCRGRRPGPVYEKEYVQFQMPAAATVQTKVQTPRTPRYSHQWIDPVAEASPLLTRKDLLNLSAHSISPLIRHTPPKRYSEQWLESETPLSQKESVVDGHGWVWDDTAGWIWANATGIPQSSKAIHLIYFLWFVLGILSAVQAPPNRLLCSRACRLADRLVRVASTLVRDREGRCPHDWDSFDRVLRPPVLLHLHFPCAHARSAFHHSAV